jgi:hypothetical protein
VIRREVDLRPPRWEERQQKTDQGRPDYPKQWISLDRGSQMTRKIISLFQPVDLNRQLFAILIEAFFYVAFVFG